MNESEYLKINKTIGIEEDRIFCFTRFLNELEALNFQKNEESRNIINYFSTKHCPTLNQYRIEIIVSEISLYKLNKKIISIKGKQFSDLQKIASAFKEEENKEEEKIFLLYNKKKPFFDYMSENTISLINLDSLKDFNHRAKQNIDLERFRANIYVDGLKPFEEFKWIGKKIFIDGKEFQVLSAIPRCKSTHYPYKSINPDANVPQLLKKAYGHVNLGIYLKPTSSIEIHLNSVIKFK